MRPRIAIPVPTSTDLPYNHLNWPAYADAVASCGGEPVQVKLDASPRELTDLAYGCQGVLLPGSPSDVNPSKYGQLRGPATAPPDLPRENVDELLLQDAHNLFKPLLGVCFGAQILNVWRSGTLIQDLVPMPVNHSAARGVAVAHSIRVDPGSVLAQTLGLAASSEAQLKAEVNSSHHQAIGIAGDGLRVSARSSLDGVVEAIEGGQAVSYDVPEQTGHTMASHHFVLGVQWHPERTFLSDPLSRALFHHFVEQVRLWTPRSVVVSVVQP